jgi:hypothetical protein
MAPSAPPRLNRDHVALLDVLHDSARVPADGLTVQEVASQTNRRDDAAAMGVKRVGTMLGELVVLGHAGRRRHRDTPLRYWWIQWP